MSQMIKFRFFCIKKVDFGKAIYIVGNVPQLGEWKPQKSLEMKCYEAQNWFIDVQIPLETKIEYKFFVANYIQNEGSQKPTEISEWIGAIDNQNVKLFITKDEGKLLQNERKMKQLRVMSFNVRTQNPYDLHDYSWETRKQNCVKLIKQQLPSILGFQQATLNQKTYLSEALSQLYQPLDCGQNQACDTEMGILYNRQRFLVVENGTKQIPQQKLKESSKGDKNKVRVFQFAILQDTYTSSKFIRTFDIKSSKKISQQKRQLFFVGNIYLDFASTNLQKLGLQMMGQCIKQKQEQYKDEIRDVFLLGDFNLPENSNLMHNFQKGDVKMESIRKNFLRRKLKDSCDLGYTFQAFEHDLHDVENPNKIIDHLYICTRDYEPTKFEVIRNLGHKSKHGKRQIISDHYPIMGVFKHKKEQQQSIY